MEPVVGETLNLKGYRYRLVEKKKRTLVIVLTLTGLLFFWPIVVFNFIRPKKLERRCIKNILIVRNDGIGDFVLSLPALRVLRKAFPFAKITLLAPSWQKEIASVVHLFDEILIPDQNQSEYFAASLKPASFFVGMLRLIPLLRKKHFDLGIDIRGDFRNRVILLLLGIPFRIGFDIGGLEYLLTHQVSYKAQIHETEHFMHLVPFRVGVTVEDVFSIPAEDLKAARNYLEQNNICVNEDLVVVVHPVSRWPAKEWPRKKFADLCDRLMRGKGAKIILVGSAEDQNAIKEVVELMKEKPLISAGILTLLQTAAAIKMAHLFIGNDAAPMHIAAAVETPVIALFGPTDPEIYGPRGQGHMVIRKTEFSCICTFQKVCHSKGMSCMDQISVEDVFFAADKLLALASASSNG